jgi:hypothetical protein
MTREPAGAVIRLVPSFEGCRVVSGHLWEDTRSRFSTVRGLIRFGPRSKPDNVTLSAGARQQAL